MARKQTPLLSKLVVSIIYSSMDALADSVSVLEKKFGRVEFETMEIETSQQVEYKEEMGDNLLRRFISFEKPVERGSLAELKEICSKIESMFSDNVGNFMFRTVNIDPGIVTKDNIIFASHREGNCNVYLANGVYAEIVLIYSRHTYRRLPWTMRDFYDQETIDFFERVRSNLLSAAKIENSLI